MKEDIKSIFREDESWAELLLLGGALKVGIFQFFANKDFKELTASQVAQGLACDFRATEIVLEALVDGGYLRKHQGLYSLSPQGREELVNKKSAKYRGNSLLHRWELIERWLELPKVIKTGEPARRERTTEGRKHFIGAMAEGAREKASEVVALCLREAPEVKKVLDLGGGPGIYAQAFARQGLEVVLQDYPEVIDLVLPSLQKERRIRFFAADFSSSLPSDFFDLAFLGNITHIYSPEENLSLFKRLAKVLNPQGYLAILDFVRGRSSGAPLFAVNMLVNTEKGGTWTEAEYDQWLSASGFKKISLYDIGEHDTQLILAQKQD